MKPRRKLLNKAAREKVKTASRKLTALVMTAVMALSTLIGSIAPTAAYAEDFSSAMNFRTLSMGIDGEGTYDASDGAVAYCGNIDRCGPTPDASTWKTFDNGWSYASDQIAAVVYNGYPYTTTIGGTAFSADEARCVTQEAVWMIQGMINPDGSYSYVYNYGWVTHSGNIRDSFGDRIYNAVRYLYDGATNGSLKAPSGLVRIYNEVTAGPEMGNAEGHPTQRMIYAPLMGTMSIQKVSGDASITDGNSCYSLEGAVYGIYSDAGCSSQVGTMTTDASGKASSGSLTAGTYYVKEITPSKGYGLDNGVYTVQVNAGQNTAVNGGTVSEPPLNDPTYVLVQKVDAETGGPVQQGSASLEGAEYTYWFFAGDHYTKTDDGAVVAEDGSTIMDADGNFSGDDPDRTWVVSTNDKGFARLGDEYLVAGESDELYYVDGIVTLPLGTLVVRETKAPEGYLISDSTFVMQVSDGGGKAVATGDIVMVDGNGYIGDAEGNQGEEIIRGGVKVRKQDSELGISTPQGDATLAGTQFQIINRSASGVVVNGVSYDPNDVVATITTDEAGNAQTSTDALPYGVYEVREGQPPVGYTHNDSWSKTFSITEDGQMIDLTDASSVLDNEVIRGGVSFRKVDAELSSASDDDSLPLGGATLAGAKIEIVNDSDRAVMVDGVLYQPGAVVMTLTTDEDGNCSTSADALPYGTYYAYESVAPEGYLLNDDWRISFQIREDGQMVDLSGDESAVADQVIRGDVSFVKVDGLDADRLAGVPFLVTSNTTGESHVIVTDDNGEASTSSDWNPHSHNTNANDAAVSRNEDGTYTVDESLLDDTAGVWFVGRTDRMTQAIDELGALPYDTYTFQELPVSANEDFDLVSFTITISRNNHTVDAGTVDDNYIGIGTNATASDGTKQLMVGESVTLTDEVLYEGLTPGKSYSIEGTLMDKETGEAVVDGEGNAVTSTVEFTPVQISGSQTVEFTFDTTGIAGHDVVVYERLLDASGRVIATHEDIEDEGQTVEVATPEIGTTATTSEGKLAMAGEAVTLTDTVSYKGLNPGESYSATGTLMDKETGEALTDAEGNEIVSTAEFTPEAPDGTVEVQFTFDTTELGGHDIVVFENGHDIVVFEKLMAASGKVIATHEDIEDEGQTVEVNKPEIGTELTDSTDGDHEAIPSKQTVLIDTVSYKGLTPGRSYRIEGVLMDQKTGQPLLVNDKEVTSEATFVPNEADGTVELAFAFDASGLKEGTNVVAFEYLYLDDLEIAVHADISDMAQTVEITDTPDGVVYDKTGVDTGLIAGVAAAGVLAAAALAAYGVIQKRKAAKAEASDAGDGSVSVSSDDESERDA